jgi:hypothetical protein
MHKGQLIEAILLAVPYPQQTTEWDIASEEGAIRFSWRGDRFRVSLNGLLVETVRGGILAGDNPAILMESLVRRAVVEIENRKGVKEPRA